MNSDLSGVSRQAQTRRGIEYTFRACNNADDPVADHLAGAENAGLVTSQLGDVSSMPKARGPMTANALSERIFWVTASATTLTL